MGDGTRAGVRVTYDPTVASYGRLSASRRGRLTPRLDELGLFGDRRVVTEVVALPFSGAKAYGFVEDAAQDFAKKNKAEYAAPRRVGPQRRFAATYKGGKATFLLDGADPWPAGSFSSLDGGLP
ncbi:peptide-methionine (S)-S-oxide reductase [Aureococcus anophagefferens]|uniref:Peptide-methionine (S)-S-oxide reductase n=1 Tax=Aureococcus anophagefferens TaxID=44056 RepID=A0ABR1FVS6_AURAN